MKFPSPEGLITQREIFALVKYLNNANRKLDVVEIGTWRGGSAVVIASAMSSLNFSSKLYTVDPFNLQRDAISKPYLLEHLKYLNINNIKENLNYCRKLFKRFNLANKIKIIPKKSFEAQKKFKRKIGFLFIDGDHTDLAIDSDLRHWTKKLVFGGILCIHDCKNIKMNHDGLKGPTRAAGNLNKSSKWVFLGHSGTSIFFCKNY